MGNLTLGGLISGMDTDTVIQKILDAESVSKNMETKRKADVQAKQDAWGKIRTSLQTLRSKMDNLRFSSNFRYRSATIADDSIATVTAASGATIADHSLTVTALATAHKVVATSTAALPTDALHQTGTFALKLGTSNQVFNVSVVDGDSLNSIRDKINKSGAGVQADVIKVVNGATTSYQLTVTSKTLGTAGKITMTESGTAVTSSAALLFKSGAAFAKESGGDDAVFSLDSQNYKMSTNTITDAIPGLSITLKRAQTMPSGASALPPINISVAADPAPTVKAVQEWAASVNDLLGLIKDNTAFNSTTNTSGILGGDLLARTMDSKLRGMLTGKNGRLPSALNQLSQVGVATGAWGSDDFGKLVVDADKLTAQLKADPDGVARVFGSLTDISTSGPVADMYKYVNGLLQYQTGAMDTTTSALSDQIKEIDKRISQMNDKLTTREQQLRAQFTQMEQAMSSLQSQGNAFMAQMGMAPSSSSSK